MSQTRGKARGFTLIELMIAVAIIAVLAAIVYPSYVNYTTNTRRAAAAACLTEAAQFMERYYTTNQRYTTAGGAAPVLPELTCQGDLAAFYNIVLAAATATTFSVTATPQGVQASRDTKCGTLGLNQSGTQSETGDGSVADCW